MKFKLLILVLIGNYIGLIHTKIIMIIRHGEKLNNQIKNLSPKGEARAKCLIDIFGHNGIYVSPEKIFAQNPTNKKQSTRPRDTVIPLARSLNLTVDLSYSNHKIIKLTKDIIRSPEEIILVSWSKENIPEIARRLGVVNPPLKWGKSFDKIWIISDGQTPYIKSSINNLKTSLRNQSNLDNNNIIIDTNYLLTYDNNYNNNIKSNRRKEKSKFKNYKNHSGKITLRILKQNIENRIINLFTRKIFHIENIRNRIRIDFQWLLAGIFLNCHGRRNYVHNNPL